jgi:DNA (cytosine-5)-methyltransferase 1
MNFLSVCSGIEAASVAWNPLGWEAVGFSDIDPFSCAFLAHRFPKIQNFGDLNNYAEWKCQPIDILCGGTPCQAFSVAGLRAGLTDPRGNLALVFLGCLDRFRPRWVVWENVPGVLSSISHDAPDTSDFEAGNGRFFDETLCYTAEEIHAFNAFLAGLSELGYGWAYRVLDAQYFGVPQHRRRVFVVGYLGDWRRAGAVLFDPDCLRRNPSARGKTGEEITGTLGARTSAGGGIGRRPEEDVIFARMLAMGEYTLDDRASTLKLRDFKAATDLVVQPVAFDCKASGRNGFGVGEVSPTLRAMGHKNSHSNGGGNAAVINHRGVRRLTPREHERLQGFPDDWTLIPYRGKPAADGPRYRAVGNSWAVPVVRWIGQRIAFVDEL